MANLIPIPQAIQGRQLVPPALSMPTAAEIGAMVYSFFRETQSRHLTLATDTELGEWAIYISTVKQYCKIYSCILLLSLIHFIIGVQCIVQPHYLHSLPIT